ncbi:putative V-type proton ATPase subunit H [Zostera marina]|uniref:V-type proton ATPase subunit H n=1 Tax=Zostera marina TaxID=29655 RepID=A0A0K9P287_ZOSMR|nr:putative V-type proton ATPase subunit H [Zostera marina]
MNHMDTTTEQVLKRVIPWDTYMASKFYDVNALQTVKSYCKESGVQRALLIDNSGQTHIDAFVKILSNVSKEDTTEYILVLVDEILSANPKRAILFHDKSLSNADIYGVFLKMLMSNNWFIQEKSCKILSFILSMRPKTEKSDEAKSSKGKITSTDDIFKALLDWQCAQLAKPSHPTRSVPVAISSLSTLLKEPCVRAAFVKADGLKFLIPLITPASTQQSIQLLYETCLSVWLLSYYDVAVQALSTTRVLQKLVEVVKGSTKEKVVRVIILTLKNFLEKGVFGAEMIDLGLPHIIQNLKGQAWSDEDLLTALNHLEEGLKENIKQLSSFEKYKQEVLLGHLEWSPMHKDHAFWRDNITNFEENDFQILRVLMTIIDTTEDPTSLAVACYDLSQFIQHHPGGRLVVGDLKAKERVMKLMNHENTEVTKYALLCAQRLFLGAKYASFLQV